jgi:hypothetical protein
MLQAAAQQAPVLKTLNLIDQGQDAALEINMLIVIHFTVGA